MEHSDIDVFNEAIALFFLAFFFYCFTLVVQDYTASTDGVFISIFWAALKKVHLWSNLLHVKLNHGAVEILSTLAMSWFWLR